MGETVTLFGYRRARDREPCRHEVPLSTREKYLRASRLLLEHGEKNVRTILSLSRVYLPIESRESYRSTEHDFVIT